MARMPLLDNPYKRPQGTFTSRSSMSPQLRNWLKKLQEELAPQVMELAAVNMAQELIDGTPVYTGRCKANWNLGLNGRPEPYHPKLFLNGGEDFYIDESPLAGMTAKDRVYVYNKTPYIQYLEAEHAEAAGWIREATQRWREFVEDAARFYGAA